MHILKTHINNLILRLGLAIPIASVVGLYLLRLRLLSG